MNPKKPTALTPADTAPPAPASDSRIVLTMIDKVLANPDLSVERLDQLLGLYQRMDSERARRSYYAAFAAMQPELPIIAKKGAISTNVKDDAGNKTGAQKKMTAYAKWEDIVEAISPILQKHGFGLSFKIAQPSPDRVAVTCILAHREGHTEETTLALPIDPTGAKNNVQGWGSSVSYAKRYTASALLNIAAREEDDDGAAGGKLAAVSGPQIAELRKLIADSRTDIAKFLELHGLDDLSEMPAHSFDTAKRMLNAKLRSKSA